MRKFLAGTAISLGAIAVTAAPAFAHDCFNASKKNPEAAKGVDVTIGEQGPEFTPTGHPGNPAFATVTVGGQTFDNVFAHSAGPKGVLPSAKNCDGKGIDSVEICLSQAAG